MISRKATRGALAAAAAGASPADALLVAAAAIEKKDADVVRALAERVRAGTAKPNELEALGFDPRPVGALFDAAAQTARGGIRAAAELAIEALRPGPNTTRPLTGVLFVGIGGVVMIGVSSILRMFIAPVYGAMNPSLLEPALSRAQAGTWFGIAASLAALFALRARTRDRYFFAQFLAAFAPWALFVFPVTTWRMIKRPQPIDRSGALLLEAAAAEVGAQVKLPGRATRVERELRDTRFDGDTPSRVLARIARLSRTDRPRIDAGKIAELIGVGFLVAGTYAMATYLLTIAALAQVIK